MKNFHLLLLLITGMIISSCYNTVEKTQNEEISFELNDSLYSYYKSKGQSIAKSSFLALSSTLLKAIDEGGAGHALSFCRVQALPITDSMSGLHQVEIKRMVKKFRNPLNAANDQAIEIIDTYESNITTGKPTYDTLLFSSGNLYYYAPIFMVPACIQCHGKPLVDYSQEHEQLIKKLYPDDKATGFAVGDLRGVWVIKFDLEKSLVTQ